MTKCSTSLAFYLFSPTCLIKSIKHEHSCKILYFLCISSNCGSNCIVIVSRILFQVCTETWIYISPTRPKVIKHFSCSTQLSMKFQLFIETKMLKNKDISCFPTLRWCFHHAYKCFKFHHALNVLEFKHL